MKHSIKSLIGFTMGATNGEIGNVKDFYFDDEIWTIRYLIVETGTWLLGRKVLITPNTLLTPEWDNKVFPIKLTKEQIKDSPDIDTDKSVSRQHEIELYEHYPWTGRKFGGAFDGGLNPLDMGAPISESITPVLETQENNTFEDSDNNPHLYSFIKLTGYTVHTSDQEIGTIEDFIVDDRNWKIDFIVVNSSNLHPGEKVTISPTLIKEIKWDTSAVIINSTLARLKDSLDYNQRQYTQEVYI